MLNESLVDTEIAEQILLLVGPCQLWGRPDVWRGPERIETDVIWPSLQCTAVMVLHCSALSRKCRHARPTQPQDWIKIWMSVTVAVGTAPCKHTYSAISEQGLGEACSVSISKFVDHLCTNLPYPVVSCPHATILL
ncbi:unnamed protein product [Ostreobium quekettii]|uniref:Uncharacterized protein n=1 Tax=Ostreobium quekettii TaxID=121088 RepID=A0A8S1JBN9_9CHLO|nr:unnamed protein product [Ostreobium quekettii]